MNILVVALAGPPGVLILFSGGGLAARSVGRADELDMGTGTAPVHVEGGIFVRDGTAGVMAGEVAAAVPPTVAELRAGWATGAGSAQAPPRGLESDDGAGGAAAHDSDGASPGGLRIPFPGA